MVLLEGFGQFKNQMTSSGIKSASFWLAAYCLNQLCYRVPPKLGGKRSLFTNILISKQCCKKSGSGQTCQLCPYSDCNEPLIEDRQHSPISPFCYLLIQMIWLLLKQ
jgi:hypothetical protein